MASALHSTIGAAHCWAGTWLRSLEFIKLFNTEPRVPMHPSQETSGQSSLSDQPQGALEDRSGRQVPECLHHMFEAQVRRAPNLIAVVGRHGSRMSYAALNERTDALAALLQAHGVGPETIVGSAGPTTSSRLADIASCPSRPSPPLPNIPANGWTRDCSTSKRSSNWARPYTA